jgi:peptidoglycan/LPS O-acetylase OafA/YrhL
VVRGLQYPADVLALSGFLVTASALRLPLRECILNRAFRIMPALGVDVALSALVLGPLFTTLALVEYFTASGFFLYFFNIIGWVHFRLPGVFEASNAKGIVNGSLWTVPYKMFCYIVMSFAIATRLIRKASVAFLVGFGWIAISAIVDFSGVAAGQGLGDKLLRFVFIDRGGALVPAFLLGSGFYLAQDKIPFRSNLAAASAAIISGVSFFLPPEQLWAAPWLTLLTICPMVYFVLWCGLSDLPKPSLIARGDYSYGIYLYHAPMLAAACELFAPANVFTLLFIAGGPIIRFAVLSWQFIERPTLKFRRRFSLVGARLAASDPRRPKKTAGRRFGLTAVVRQPRLARRWPGGMRRQRRPAHTAAVLNDRRPPHTRG